jgi:hypothetical protein
MALRHKAKNNANGGYVAKAHNEYREKVYAPLGEYLASLPASTKEVTLTFAQVEEIVGRRLPDSAREHREWWANQAHGSRAYHWQDAGFKTGPVNMRRETVRFFRYPDAPISLRLPRPLTLQDVVTELNETARNRPIGALQGWRKQQSALERPGASTLFYSRVKPTRDWVFHAGGLLELQFNVGFEDVNELRVFRHGVALSLQPTRELPDIEPMRPKIARFNEYVLANPGAFEGFSMWHWDDGRTPNFPVSTIPNEAIHQGNFIFIGALQPADRVSIDWTLDDFDRLLPLYQYVESQEPLPRVREKARKGFIWSPGNKARAARTTYERNAAAINKNLRHNTIQDALFNHLEALYGKDDTSGEQDCGNHTLVDVAVRDGEDYTYYELRTAPTAQLCIREAIGQLLEYSYWPGAQQATRLVVVGEPPCDKETAAYIRKLQRQFSLPIEYRQFDMNAKCLVSEKT